MLPTAIRSIAPQFAEKRYDSVSSVVEDAIELYKADDIMSLCTLLSDNEIARSVGVNLHEGRKKILEANRPIDIKSVADNIANNCRHNYYGSEHQIILGTVGVYDFSREIPRDLGFQALPKGLQKEVALLYLEEWCHELQSLLPKETLTGIAEKEYDIVIYMLQNGMELSNIWLRRYDRARFLSYYFGIEPKVVYEDRGFPINVGDVLNVRRSNGLIEAGWVINAISSDSVELQRSGMKKEVSINEIRTNNDHNISTYFTNADGFVELFTMIDTVGFFVDPRIRIKQLEYKPAYIKRVINQIRKGQDEYLDLIPQQGGLRYAVHQLIIAERNHTNLRG